MTLLRLPLNSYDDTLERIVRRAAAVVDARAGFMSVVIGDLEHLVAHAGLPAELEVSRALARDFGLAAIVVDAADFVVLDDTVGHARVRPELVDAFGVRAFVGAPIVIAGIVAGTLAGVDTRPRQFDRDMRAEFGRLAAEAGAHLTQMLRDVRAEPAAVKRLPYLRLLQAAQVGALTADGLRRALSALPPVPVDG
jgi:GAF domain-containing protein